MDSSSRFLSVVATVLFLTAGAYLGAVLFTPRERNVVSESAPREEPLGYAEITGIAVRREQGVCSPDTAIDLQSGERVPCGAAVAEGLFTESSSVFFADSDGYEYLSPDELTGLTAEKLDGILALPPGSAGSGRLVTGRAWYVAAFSDQLPPDSGPVRLRIDGLDGVLRAEIAEVSEENGRYTVLLRLTEGSPEALSLRKITGKLIADMP